MSNKSVDNVQVGSKETILGDELAQRRPQLLGVNK